MKFFIPIFYLFTFWGLVAPLTSFAEPEEINIALMADTHLFNLPFAQVESWNHIEFQTSFNPTYQKEWENTNICFLPSLFCSAFLSKREQNTQRITADSEIQIEKITQYLSDLKSKSDTSGSPSSVEPTDNPTRFIFHRGEDGLQLAEEENLNLLEDITRNPASYIGKTTNLSFEKTNSTLSAESRTLGLREKIGEGVSNFKGSSNDRIFNITHALKNFDAVLVAPGETFSFTKTLGPVEEWTGYRPELVIRNNKTEPEYGGGICQVSTTFFRSAVNTGLEIVSRRNHSYPVSYYKPIGFDATVYYPNPDLKIKNNFAHNILFVPYIDGKDLHFEIYGTPDGRTVDVTLPVITERGDDGSLKTQFTQTVKDTDGNTLIDRVFKSAYDSPDKYPHPGDIEFTTKPKDWSKKQWEKYKKEKGL